MHTRVGASLHRAGCRCPVCTQPRHPEDCTCTRHMSKAEREARGICKCVECRRTPQWKERRDRWFRAHQFRQENPTMKKSCPVCIRGLAADVDRRLLAGEPIGSIRIPGLSKGITEHVRHADLHLPKFCRCTRCRAEATARKTRRAEIRQREAEKREAFAEFRAARAKWKEKQRAVGVGRGRHHHGMDEEAWEAFLRTQGNVCTICARPITVENANLDHDHDRAATHEHGNKRTCRRCQRDALCSKCNTMLGAAQDSVELLQKGIDYIITWRRTHDAVAEDTDA